jgi:membrane complex biogenesis BtpA family protein
VSRVEVSHAARLVGVIHLMPLPGSPRAAGSITEAITAAARDGRILASAGFDVAMIENFGDAPFLAGRVAPVTVSAMTACAMAVRHAAPDLALGINVLRNDADAAVAIALTVDATCVRVNVHTGARLTDQGIIQGDAATTLRTRRALGAERIEIWADVDVKHSAPLAPRPIGQEAADLVTRGLASAVLVTGEGTGLSVDVRKLEEVRRSVAVPVLVASGATENGLAALTSLCDGVIVGSALRSNGRAGGPIDEGRARSFAAAFRRAFPAR